MTWLFILLVGSVIFNGCDPGGTVDPRVAGEIKQEVDAIGREHCPERRTTVYDVQAEARGGEVVLRGETSSRAAYDELRKHIVDWTIELGGQLADSVALLPQASLGDSTWGLVRLSVADMRKEKNHRAELISQVTMGAVVRVLKSKRNWYRIQSADDYLGWVIKGAVARCAEPDVQRWRQRAKLRYDRPAGVVRGSPGDHASVVRDLVLGSRVAELGEQGAWMRVQLPDGAVGYVRSDDVGPLQPAPLTRQAIIRSAESLVGIPYVWGGTSARGLDCSGLTQAAFGASGHELPRDANMQVMRGDSVEVDSALSHLRPADLIFFGQKPERITHVGIYLGEGRFIHADGIAGCVSVASLREDSKDYDSYRRRTLQKARRVIGP